MERNGKQPVAHPREIVNVVLPLPDGRVAVGLDVTILTREQAVELAKTLINASGLGLSVATELPAQPPPQPAKPD